MARELLKDSSGNEVVVEEGEVAKITCTFSDYDAANLATASLLSLTMTLRNAEDGAVINSRNGTDILNANNGTVADVAGDATLTLILDESDNDNIGGLLGGLEEHWLDLLWTWNDGVAVRTGKAAYKFNLRITDASISSTAAWIG